VCVCVCGYDCVWVCVCGYDCVWVYVYVSVCVNLSDLLPPLREEDVLDGPLPRATVCVPAVGEGENGERGEWGKGRTGEGESATVRHGETQWCARDTVRNTIIL
jgi:hypothetical protein